MQMLFNVAVIAFAIEVHPQNFLQKDVDLPEVQHEKEAGGGYLEGSPMYETQEKLANYVPPVSTTMKCIINLTAQYFILYTAVLVCHTFGQYTKSKEATKVAKALEIARQSVDFAPMLSILFLGTRMRALQLSQGNPDEHNLPQPFAKNGMQMCAWSVLAQCVFSLAQSAMTSEKGGSTVEKVLNGLQWVTMVTLYTGFTLVCYGAYSMEAPESLWANGAPPVSPAVACTMNLCLQYFLVALLVQVAKSYRTFAITEKSTFEQKKQIDQAENLLKISQNTLAFAPMLCILFIGARMRALQIDPVNGAPQAWAQNCFYLCTYAVLVQILLVFVLPIASLAEPEQGQIKIEGSSKSLEIEGDISFKSRIPSVVMAIEAARYLIMLSMYGGFSAVIYSVIVIEAPAGQTTPPVSSAMKCVMNLTIQYFLVFLVLQILLTIKGLGDGQTSSTDLLNKCIMTVNLLKTTVRFCPMLCVLFIGLRMRALQITKQKGAPQGWAQEAMFLASYAVLIQLILGILTPDNRVLGDEKDDKKEEETPATGKKSTMGTVWQWVKIVLEFFRYFALVCLYGGACICCYAVFTITPETADGSGSLIPGVSVPKPTM